MSQPWMSAPTGIAARHILALQLATPVSEALQREAMPAKPCRKSTLTPFPDLAKNFPDTPI